MADKTHSAYEDLLSAQKEIGVILKDKDNPYFKSKYADINSILAAAKPVLNKYNWVILQALTTIDGNLGLRTLLIHTSGEKIEDFCPLPQGADAQKIGGIITYFRRYALQSLLALEADDDDGNAATNKTVAPVAPAVYAPKAPAKREKKVKGVMPPYPTPESQGLDMSKPPFEDDVVVKKEGEDDLDFIGK